MKKFASFLVFVLICVIGLATYAYFTSYYTVTFISDGVGSKKKIMKGKSILNEYNPSKEGYKFLYWMDDNTIVDTNYNLDYNAILVAVFDKIVVAKTYTVKFDTDGGNTIEDQTVKEGDTIKEPEAPVKQGYVFKEWVLDDKGYDFNEEVTKDITLKAVYIKESVKTYLVNFNTDGGSHINSRRVEEGGVVTRPSNPVKQGYTFKEWHLNGVKYNFGQKVTKNITLVAVYKVDERKTYTIKFDTKGGSAIANQLVKNGDKVTEPTAPTKEGYAFAGWLYNNNKYDFSTKINSDMTLEAVYYAVAADTNAYVISFDTDGGSPVSSQLVKEGDKVTKPSNPTKSGYTFKEWTFNGESYNFNTPVTKIMLLKATYTKNKPEEKPKEEQPQVEVKKYTVIFDSEGGTTVSSQQVKEGDKVTKPSNPTKSGYTFKEWLYMGNSYDFNTPVTSNMTLLAAYDEEIHELKRYTVAFDTDGGNAISSQQVNEGDRAVKPANPEKEGYTFVRWEYNGTEYNFNATVTMDITLRAVYKVKEVEQPQPEPNPEPEPSDEGENETIDNQ